MKKNILVILALLICACFAEAQTVSVRGKIVPQDKAEGAKVYIASISAGSEGMIEAKVENGAFVADVKTADDGFYNLILIRNQSQAILPLFFSDTEKEVSNLELNLTGAVPAVNGSIDNNALSEYANIVYTKDRAVWTDGPNMSVQDFKIFIDEYISKAESVAKASKCSATVADYIRLWGYVSAYNSFTSYLRVSGKKAEELDFSLNDVMSRASKLLDSSLASLFTGVQQIVLSTLPKDADLSTKIDFLRTNYSNEKIRGAIENVLVESYITKFNYSEGYDNGYAVLKTVVDKYGLDKKYLADFEKRRATVKGAAFPESVVLKDAEGNTVDFSMFKGKYVYIDLWASWCGPCIKEVPHLQKLEAELENKNVVFLSISVDAKEEQWKAKMKQLNMHGNQLHNKDNSLCNNLNVKGIPFFLIYDKEGNLYMYNAPRPSHPGLKILLEELK